MSHATTTLSLQWTRTSPSTFERKLDDFEKFYRFIATSGQGRPDKQNWHCTSAIAVSTPRADFARDVKQAWTALRYDHPTLAAVVRDEQWLYTLADQGDEMSSWLDETFHVYNTPGQTARQLFPFNSNPSQRTVLHVLPHSQEIVLQGPHTHFDGIGAAVFLDHLLRLLVGPESNILANRPFGQEGINLTPPLAIAANVPDYTPAHKATWDKYMHEYLSNFPTVRIHNENQGATAQHTKLQWLTFTPDETKAIVTRCRELGFTLTAAAQAAISHSARLHGQVSNTNHSTYAIYDARQYIDPELYPPSTLVGPHVFATATNYPLSPDSFADTAKAVRQKFMDGKNDDFLRASSAFWGEELPKTLAAPLPADFPVLADLQLSSIGVVDKYLQPVYSSIEENARPDVAVHDVWFALDMFTPNIAVDVWTSGGRLVMELIYNEAYHREESVRMLMGLIHEQLVQGLGLELGFDARASVDGWVGDVPNRAVVAELDGDVKTPVVVDTAVGVAA